MLCPELVGRGREQLLLRARVDDLADGRGGLVVLLGEAGAGKTRLAQGVVDAAAAAGRQVLAGRAVPSASPLPYRPLTEAFLAAFRSSGPPEAPALDGFGAHLGRLVPAWRTTPSGAEESPVLLGEAVVRLLVHAGAAGSVLLVEDVHWADAETLDVLDYLADALPSEPVLCVCTSRPDGAASELITRLQRRDPTALIRVGPLDDAGVDEMLGACLGVRPPPAQLSDFLRAHSDGSPFLVEELLAGLVSSGELRLEDGGWTSGGDLTPTVPASLRASVQRRLGSMDVTTRRVLGAAALLGRRFEWELLPGIAEVDGRAAVDGLRAAVDAQLIQADGTGFTFRHALTREAVLAGLLPPERRDLASRAWPAHERANAGLPGPTLELAAELAEAAGEPVAAAHHLVASARRALDNGALTTAEATVRRAIRLAEGDEAATFDAAEGLVHVLVAAGKPAEALRVAHHLGGGQHASVSPTRRADLLLVTSRAALAAGDTAGAVAAAASARETAGGDVSAELQARLDAVGAEVALAGADLPTARRLADAALDGATITGQPEVECLALLVIGAVVRTVERMEGAVPFYERASAVAATAGLARLHLRAQQELALIVWSRGDLQPLHDVRQVASRYGALVTVAAMDLSLADVALTSYDRDACLVHARACAEASHRYGLATDAVAHLWLAGAHALAGDHEAMQAAIDVALDPDPDDPRILADLYGRVLPTSAFVDDDLDRLPALLDTMIDFARVAPPAESVYPGRIPWALLHTIDDDDHGVGARAELAEASARIGLLQFEASGELIEAVALGRRGDAEAATARATPAYEALVAHPLGAGGIHALGVLAARAALRDGWGEPVRWLRAAEAFFGGRGYDALARRCRTMLGEAGEPVPRRRGESEVPTSLRALGVTGREVDVLRRVAAGRTNKEIAADLFLSPKTVERHLSSLFTRLAVANRRDLAATARPYLGEPNP